MKKVKWWWSWEADQYETYLEEMALKGYKLKSASLGLTLLEFEKIDPRPIAYQVDYQNKLTEEYQLLLEDDGWELVASSTGWYLWCQSYEGDRPHIYSDVQSLLDRNQRVLVLVGILLASQLPLMIINLNNVYESLQAHFSISYALLIAVYCFGIIFMIYGIMHMLIERKRLKQSRV